MAAADLRGPSRREWVALILATVAVVATGYGVFLYFLKGFSPTSGSLSLMIFAVVAGIATFFSPCSFPLMPGFLTRHIQLASGARQRTRTISTLSNGLAAAGGVLLFDLTLGLVILILGLTFGGTLAISNSSPNIYVRTLRGSVGLILIGLGLLGLRGVGIFHAVVLNSFGRIVTEKGQVGPRLEMFAYGFGYVSIGIGCAGPILSALLIFALSFGGTVEALWAFTLFAGTMAAMMIGVSLLVLVSPSILTRLAEATPRIKTAASLIQISVGVFLIFAAYYNRLFVQLLFPS